MLDFIYDSLDTVKKLKFPTWKQVLQLTLGIFVLVIVAGAYFILADTLFSDGYRGFYSLMTNQSISARTGDVQDTSPSISVSGAAAILSGSQVITGASVSEESATGLTQ